MREFWVVKGREGDFEKLFRPAGMWPELLRRSDKYLRTEIRPRREATGQYRIFDYWRSHWDFEAFRAKYQYELEDFRRASLDQALVQREVFEGSFYELDPDSGPEEGTEMVPS